MSKRVLVCGGRNWGLYDPHQDSPEREATAADERFILKAMLSEALNPEDTFIGGGCTGADDLAEEFARGLGCTVEIYAADWSKYGRSAGPRRNRQMLTEGRPDIVIAFPGGHGTADMVRKARAAGVTVREVKP